MHSSFGLVQITIFSFVTSDLSLIAWQIIRFRGNRQEMIEKELTFFGFLTNLSKNLVFFFVKERSYCSANFYLFTMKTSAKSGNSAIND